MRKLFGWLGAALVFIAVVTWRATVWSYRWTWRVLWITAAALLVATAALVGWLIWRRHKNKQAALLAGPIAKARELAAAPVAALFPPPAVEDRVA